MRKLSDSTIATMALVSAFLLGLMTIGPWITLAAFGAGIALAGLTEALDNPRDE